MAVTSDVKIISAAPKHRTKSPGVRVIRGIVYDSENGKTCHQCRQKTRVFAITCKNVKKGKHCTISFCCKCLMNRYGEDAEKSDQLEGWTCPKCRGICNCSQCRKKSGLRPTGQVTHKAKESGFSSVSEMLCVKGPDCVGIERKITQEIDATLKEEVSEEKDSVVDLVRKPGKENSFDGNCDSDLKEKKSKKVKREELKEKSQDLAPKSKEKKSKKAKREELKEISSIEGVDAQNLAPKLKEKKSKKAKQEESKEMSSIEGVNAQNLAPELKKKKSKRVKQEELNETCNGVKAVDASSKNDAPSEAQSLVETKKNKKTKIHKDKVSEQMIGQKVVTSEKDIKDSKADSQLQAVSEAIKAKKRAEEQRQKEIAAEIAAAIPLPEGTNLTTVVGIQINPEDVGNALQFLEFCAAFGEVLGLRKGEAEYILRELTRGRVRRKGQCCPIVQFHIKLMSFLQDDEETPLSASSSGKNSWLHVLKECVEESKCPINDVISECCEGDGYEQLDCSKKLKLLNFLCDEILNTITLRDSIEERNSKYIEEEKQIRANIAAAKDKEKQLRQKINEEHLKLIIPGHETAVTVAEREAAIAKLKSEKDTAQSEKLQAIDMVLKKRSRSDAVRTESILVEENGHAFWRLKGYAGKPDILLQDLQGNWDANAIVERWLVFDAHQKPSVEEYISSRKRELGPKNLLYHQ